MKWITYSRTPLERLSPAWLIARFIDPQAQFLFESEDQMDAALKASGAIPFGIDGVEFSSDDAGSAFDKILFSYRFTNPALAKMSEVLRRENRESLEAALTEAGQTELIEQIGEAQDDEAANIGRIFPVYDAIYQWCRSLQQLPERWEPKTNAGKIF